MHMPDRRPVHAPRRRGMTLLEILGVMLIFFIIWAFVFPAAEGMVENSRRRQASADVHAIASALLEYRRAYGVFPGAGEEDVGATDIAYVTTAGKSSGVPSTSSDSEHVRDVEASVLSDCLLPGASGDSTTGNPRRIPFLEPDHARFRDGILLDPWGAPYIAIVDANADGWIGAASGDNEVSWFTITGSGTTDRTHVVPGIRESVYVFSWTQTGIQSNRVVSAGGLR